MKRPNLLLLILAVAVVIRLGLVLALGNSVEILPGTYDQVSYHTLAQRILAGHGFTFGEPWWPLTKANEPTAHWSFLYTFYMAAVYKIFGVNPLVARLIQAVVVGLLHPYLAYRLGRRLFDDQAGLAAAALTAVYAYFAFYAASLMTESFYITAILGTLYLAIRLVETDSASQRRLALALGFVLGLTILFRQLYLLFVPFLFLWLWWASFKRRGGWPVVPTILAVAVMLAMILPFTFYNYARFGRFVLLNTNAGYAFYLANHPIYGANFVPILPNYADLLPAGLADGDEAALDQELLRLGLQFVVDDPGRYALLSLSRIPHYFMFWPSADSSLASNAARVLSFGLTWPLMLAGLVLALRRTTLTRLLPQPAALLLLFALVYTAIHILSWALIRYRLPVDAVMLMFAGLAVAAIARFLAARAGRRLPAGAS